MVLQTPPKDSVLTLISCLYLIVCLLIVLFIVYITKSLDSCGIKILNFAIWLWFALIEVGFCSFISSMSSYYVLFFTVAYCQIKIILLMQYHF